MRHGDVAEGLPPAGALHLGHGVVVGGDGHQPRQQQHHRVARALPQVEDEHHPKGRRGLEPIRQGQAQREKQLVYQPFSGKEQIHQQHRARHGHHIGQKEHRAQQLEPPGLPFQKQRQPVGHQQNDRQPYAQKAQGVPKGHAEHVVLEHPAVIFQAHKQLAFPGALGQGVPHHLAKGQHVKQQEAQQQRPGKEIALPRPFHTPHSANVISMVETVRSTSSSRDSSGLSKCQVSYRL